MGMEVMTGINGSRIGDSTQNQEDKNELSPKYKCLNESVDSEVAMIPRSSTMEDKPPAVTPKSGPNTSPKFHNTEYNNGN